MNDDPSSLDRLHDIALPAEVSWWPMASGWYFVIAIVLLLLLQQFWKAWLRWNANAYRREAIKQLADSQTTASVAEVLRRVALAAVPRCKVAELSGDAWVHWLSETCQRPVPVEVKEQLTCGLYRANQEHSDTSKVVDAMKEYAAYWIAEHTIASTDSAA